MKRPILSPQLAIIVGIFAHSWILAACKPAAPESVSVTFVDPEWSHDTKVRRDVTDVSVQEFSKQTGIRVHHLPAPESVGEQLQLTRQLMTMSPELTPALSPRYFRRRRMQGRRLRISKKSYEEFWGKPRRQRPRLPVEMSSGV